MALTTLVKTVPGLTILGQHSGLHPQDWEGDSVDHMAGLINGMQITPGLHGDADNPRTAQPTRPTLGLSTGSAPHIGVEHTSGLVHMGADPRTAPQDSQHLFETAATSDWSLICNFSDYHQTDDDFELSLSRQRWPQPYASIARATSTYHLH